MAFFRYIDGMFFAQARTKGEDEGDAALLFESGDHVVAGIALSKDNIDFLIETLQECREYVPDTIKDPSLARQIVKNHKDIHKETRERCPRKK